MVEKYIYVNLLIFPNELLGPAHLWICWHIMDFLGSRWMETAPTSIEVLLRSNLVQTDEPSDLRGSLSLTTRHRCTHVLVYTAPCTGSPRRSPIQLSDYGPGLALLNFSDRANTDELTPYSVYNCKTSVFYLKSPFISRAD